MKAEARTVDLRKRDEAAARRLQTELAILTVLSPAFSQAAEGDPDGARMAARLTPRERVVVGCIADAMGNEGLAEYLGMSIETVKRHLSTIFDKLGMYSRTEVAVAVYRRPALRAAIPIPSLMREADSVTAG